MFTDPEHLRVSDPGRVEGNVVFAYLEAFDSDRDGVADLEARYRKGGLGDVALKRRLDDTLQELLAPIRTRRAELARDPEQVFDTIRRGSQLARDVVSSVLSEVRDAFHLHDLKPR
jgi:tryptophanyl-tRNA synthetase